MMVIFVSQCQKKALSKTRRVLDSFANRIGDNTWKTVITEDGLTAVKKLLSRTASKNTAVACHWIRSRSRSELIWVVGNRGQFNEQGVVAVNSTQKIHHHSEWENNWVHLPVIKALVAMAALLHDWGKSNKRFQHKLTLKEGQADPLRHEWISCLLLNALVSIGGENSDEGWLTLLAKGELDEDALKKTVKEKENPLKNLPYIAQLVGWLILTHHRMPTLDTNKKNDYADASRRELSCMLASVSAQWSYANKGNADECLIFPHGLLSDSSRWVAKLKRWAEKLLSLQSDVQRLKESGADRVVLHHARLCLMLGDYHYSSQEKDTNWGDAVKLFANTDKNNIGKKIGRQKLDEHLVHVSQSAVHITQSLSRFVTDMKSTNSLKSLAGKSPSAFRWQDKAVDHVMRFKASLNDQEEFGCFVVNMASTGCGKTIANAKIMQALSLDGKSLRFILALGLRTLTMQTGDEYRHRIGLSSADLAVIIGSAATQALHQAGEKKEEASFYEDTGSESSEELLDEEINYEDAPTDEWLKTVIRYKKHEAFLYKPVLVCTIDHIIAATETTRGNKYILPSLRLLSSDLVIDEVDDFGEKDLIAIGRLVHLAGMLGRKVMISSATIPPALAKGFFHAYQEGWRLYCAFKGEAFPVASAWIDEFTAEISLVRDNQFSTWHDKFIEKRIEYLRKQPIKRKGDIIPCDYTLNKESYFEKIKITAIALHEKNHMIDKKTGKRVSFGVIRMANIPPCVALTLFLVNANWPSTITPRIMAYHSRQVLLLRHYQELHLDAVLKRKDNTKDNVYEGCCRIIM